MTANRASAVCAGQLTYSGRVRSMALAHFNQTYTRGAGGLFGFLFFFLGRFQLILRSEGRTRRSGGLLRLPPWPAPANSSCSVHPPGLLRRRGSVRSPLRRQAPRGLLFVKCFGSGRAGGKKKQKNTHDAGEETKCGGGGRTGDGEAETGSVFVGDGRC